VTTRWCGPTAPERFVSLLSEPAGAIGRSAPVGGLSMATTEVRARNRPSGSAGAGGPPNGSGRAARHDVRTLLRWCIAA
jgi:hypothetical protein